MNLRQPGGRSAGVTLAELLVVVSVIALAITVAIPLIANTVASVRSRTAAEQLAVTLRAVRMLAVTHQEPRDLTIKAAPDNYYEFVDSQGVTRRQDMPRGVTIASFEMPPGTASGTPVTFRANGSISGGTSCVTKIEAPRTAGVVEVWEISTNALGMTHVEHRLQ